MKIAHLTTIDVSLKYLLLPQLVAARDAGHEVVGISAPGPFVKDLERDGIRHVPLRSSTRGMDVRADLRAARELARILHAERFDVLHTHTPKPGVYGRIVGRLVGVPRVVNTVHGYYATPDDRLTKRLAVYGLEAVASRFSHIELFQSSEDFHLATRWRLAPHGHAVLLGNGVDVTRFVPAAPAQRADAPLRRKLGVGPTEIVVCSVGRLVREKGFLELTAAAERLQGLCRIVVAGKEEPDKSDALSRAQIARGEAAGIIFLGHVDDVEALYTASDIFVLASHREGVPRAAIEAAACGLPVVATDIRGCREAVAHRVTGLLVPAKTVESLHAAIHLLISQPDTRRTFGEAGRRRVEVRFNESRITSAVLDSYGHD